MLVLENYVETGTDLALTEAERAAEVAALEAVWEAPTADVGSAPERQDWVIFVVFVIVWATALAYAAYCTGKGGHPNISFSWRGFKVQCNS